MCISVLIRVYIHMYVHTHIYLSTSIHRKQFFRVHLHICTCSSIHIYVYMNIRRIQYLKVVSPQSVPLTNYQKFQGAVTETAHAAHKRAQEINDSKEVQNFKQNATDFVEDKEKRGINIYRIHILYIFI
jgi:hypothetical protein